MLTRRITHPALPIDPFLLSLDDRYCREEFLLRTEGIERSKHLPRFTPAQERAYQTWIEELFEVAAEDGWECSGSPADFAPEERSTVVLATPEEAAAALPATDAEWAGHILETTYAANVWTLANAII